ncbi:MAG: type I DNA topoisomerase [Phototrophicaceae bacterium]
MTATPIVAHCLTCKEKREIQNPQVGFTDSGRPSIRGVCPVCGKTLVKIGMTEAHQGLPKPEIKPPEPKIPAKRGPKPKPKPENAEATKAAKAPKKTRKAAARRRSTGKLVIVESPAKAKSVGRYLGRGYTVKASKGHVRDLLKSRMSVDIENDFEPEYRIPNEKRETVKELKADVEGATEIFLATDPDREGEAIAWHLIAAADMANKPLKRVVFHEITESAVQEAFEHPRNINMDLVNAQQTRRILDRLVGYTITPLLWEKVRNHLSAGRVQSIALRFIVEREHEVRAFVPVEYWSLESELRQQQPNGKQRAQAFIARLVRIQDETPTLNSAEGIQPHLDYLSQNGVRYEVGEIKRSTRKRRPSAPFTTSTLQQEASRRLGFSTTRTMQLAQQLYEGIELDSDGPVGLITYMRTDSMNVSVSAQQEAREFIEQTYGVEYRPETPPIYKTKAKSAQEAHEAIRPTSIQRLPERVAAALGRIKKDGRDLLRLYTLIWQRFVASQMEDAIYNTLRVDIQAGLPTDGLPYQFRVSGSTIKFRGFLALYEETQDEDATPDEDEGRLIPDLTTGELLDLLRLIPEQHFTQPPPRYTEATLIRTLEEYGIGRPSTYAPTVRVIKDRNYVTSENKRLVPTPTGETVTELLVMYFPDVLDYNFTARLEDKLDAIAEGEIEWRPVIREFYSPIEEQIQIAQAKIPKHPPETMGRTCPTCGDGQLLIKYSRSGSKFVGCSNFPNCRHTENYVEATGLPCPICGTTHGGQVIAGLRTKTGRQFYGCNRYPDCEFRSWQLPKAATEETEAEYALSEQDIPN